MALPATHPLRQASGPPPVHRIRALQWFVTACVAALLVAPCPGRAENHAPEYAVKAAFLYNFTKFVEWPEESFPGPDSPLTVCVLGDAPLGASLDALQGKLVRNRPIEVRRARTPEEAQACHVLFVTEGALPWSVNILATLRDKPVLTVGEHGEFTRAGGILNFVLVDNRVRFEINPAAASASGLKISSQLLKLARIAEGEGAAP